jgi:hypothetical protein
VVSTSAPQRAPIRTATGENSRIAGNSEVTHATAQSFPETQSDLEENLVPARDSNSQAPVSKTGCYSNSHTLGTWCTAEDLNLRVPLGETGVTAGPFRAHAPEQTWRKVDDSKTHRSSRRPSFQDQLPAVPGRSAGTFHMAESTGVEPISLL